MQPKNVPVSQQAQVIFPSTQMVIHNPPQQIIYHPRDQARALTIQKY
jgi:hypothetical protein